MKVIVLAILAAVLVFGLWGAYSAATQLQHALVVQAAKVAA